MASIAKSFEIAGAKCGMSGKTLIVPSVSNLRMTQKPSYSKSQVEHTRSAFFGPNQRELAVHSSYGPQHPISRGGHVLPSWFGWLWLGGAGSLVWIGLVGYATVRLRKIHLRPQDPQEGSEN